MRWSVAAAVLLLVAVGDGGGPWGAAGAADWAALKDELSQTGVAPTVTYTSDTADVASGGAKRGVTYSGDLHVQLGFDGARLAGVPGLSGWLDGLWVSGGLPSGLAGDAQGLSSIAAPPAVRLYEGWLQYNFAGNRISVLAGRYDLNTEFYRLASAQLFLNSSFGVGAEFAASGFAGPSIFPDTSVGVRVAYKGTADTVLRVAVLDGAPLDRAHGSPGPWERRNGLLLVAEAAWLGRPANARPPDADAAVVGSAGAAGASGWLRIGRSASRFPYDDKVAVGAWEYTARFDDQDAATGAARQHERGAYLLLDHLLFKAAGDPQRRVTGFFEAGVADPAADRFGSYIGAGLTAVGLLRPRPDDEVGIAMAMARNGSHYLAAQHAAGVAADAAETTIEVSYQAQLTPWLTMQPDVQYVLHPDTDPGRGNAVVALVRAGLSF